MLSVFSLWLPILLSAILVFIVSSIIHMVLTYHRSDFVRVPQEDAVREALRSFDIPPGEYVMPHAADPKAMSSPEYIEKTKQGPVAFITMIDKGPPRIAKSLVQWFVYCLIVGVFVAYLTGRTLSPGADYMSVFRIAGTAAFLGYAVALWQNSIWYKRGWLTTAKSTVDGLVYALLTAGSFGGLWPAT